MALPGFFTAARAEFVECDPADACNGGVTALQLMTDPVGAARAACSSNYAGSKCASCSSTAYRLKSTCHPCPNTAWLLFLLFSLAIMALVAIAVYLSKKKINLAGLSIGVVRVAEWVWLVC